MKVLVSNSEICASTELDQSSQERIVLSDYKYSLSNSMTPAEMLDECERACEDIDDPHERAMDEHVLMRFKGMFAQLEKSPWSSHGSCWKIFAPYFGDSLSMPTKMT